jgi:magnesium chelatase family protein
MLSKVSSFSILGIEAFDVLVEVNITKGVNFFMVGLPDVAVKESHHRIYSAIQQSGLKYPMLAITVNLAPADIRKEGSVFDLPIATGILASSGQIPAESVLGYSLVGELSLDGSLRPVKGILPMAFHAKKKGMRGIVVPAENVSELGLINDFEIIACRHLAEVVEFFRTGKKSDIDVALKKNEVYEFEKDFSDVYGQEQVKRALEIAAAGGHHVLLSGPPGSGKSMLCSRLPGILPPLTMEEKIETSIIYSVNNRSGYQTNRRPFRSPHHTISDVALVGGGNIPRPGEISLAHNGVLFLDELTEFKRSTLEVLRQPLEEKKVHISRSRFQVNFPADFMLVAGMNPCPCGYLTHPKRKCVCSSHSIEKYSRKISGPLMDRFDIRIEVLPVELTELSLKRKGEKSAEIARRVEQSRKIQEERFKGKGIKTNSGMGNGEIEKYCALNNDGLKLLNLAAERMNFSARAYQKILRVARTIADLDLSPDIRLEHLAEAIQYRTADNRLEYSLV